MNIDTALPKPKEIYYPSSDGKPMADSDKQFNLITKTTFGLMKTFKDQNKKAYVAGDLFWYPVEGNPNIRKAPDVLVAVGRPQLPLRKSYLQWKEENITPQIVFEFISDANTKREMAQKHRWYEKYGVEEYYLYDLEKCILKVFIRENGKLRLEPGITSYTSKLTGIRTSVHKNDLELYHPNGKPFLSYMELAQKHGAMVESFRKNRDLLLKQKEQLNQQNQLLANKNQQLLEKELLLNQQQVKITSTENRLEQEKQRAEQEKQKAEQSAIELKLLKQKLRSMGIDPSKI